MAVSGQRSAAPPGQSANQWSLRPWLWVVLCSAVIFSTIPLARGIQYFIYDTFGQEFFTYAVLSFIIGTVSVFLYFFVRVWKIHRAMQYVWMLTCFGLFVFFTLHLTRHPEEAVHLIEYAVLSYFVFRALNVRVRDWTVYLSALLIVNFIGTADEIVQWLLPGRFWDYRDAGINALAGGIFLLFLWKGLRPATANHPVQTISVLTLSRLIVLNIILLGFCLSNTPDAVAHYARFSDSLSWLQHEEPMTEYGYRHRDPGAGMFYSRFTKEELITIDRTQGTEFGSILRRNIHSWDDLRANLRVYSPSVNTFLHEFLTHAARRDSAIDVLLQGDESGAERIQTAAELAAENSIIAKYFAHTANAAGLLWPATMTDDINRAVKGSYVSGAGKLITAFSWKSAMAVLIALLVLTLVLGRIIDKRHYPGEGTGHQNL